MSIPAGTLREHSHKIASKRPRQVTPASLHSLQPPASGAILQRAALAPESLRPADFLRLQQTVGNRATGGLLDRPSGQRPVIQEKLTVNAPGDEYEREADRVALRVGEQVRTSPREPPSPSVQRQHGRENDNTTGIPDHLKAGIECLSGLSLADVKVHYNSSQPAQLQALAYTQGTDIHVGPGQEKHLAHEAWHVVQQKQGRVKPTLQSKGVQINDDQGLEHEAEIMGGKATDVTPSRPSRDQAGLDKARSQREPIRGPGEKGAVNFLSQKHPQMVTADAGTAQGKLSTQAGIDSRLSEGSRGKGVLQPQLAKGKDWTVGKVAGTTGGGWFTWSERQIEAEYQKLSSQHATLGEKITSARDNMKQLADASSVKPAVDAVMKTWNNWDRPVNWDERTTCVAALDGALKEIDTSLSDLATLAAKEEAAKKKAAEEEAARKKAEEEAAIKKAEEEAERKKAEEEAARKKAEEEAARKKAEEEAARKRAEEEAARKKAEEEAARKRAEEEAARKRAEEEAARKRAEEEAARKKAAEKKAAAEKRWEQIDGEWAAARGKVEDEIKIATAGLDFEKTVAEFGLDKSKNKPWDWNKWVNNGFNDKFNAMKKKYNYPPTTTKYATPDALTVQQYADEALPDKQKKINNETRRFSILKEAKQAVAEKLSKAKAAAILQGHLKVTTTDNALTVMQAEIEAAKTRQLNMDNANWVSRIGHSITKDFNDRRPVSLKKTDGEQEIVLLHVSIYPDARTRSSYIAKPVDTKKSMAKDFYTLGLLHGQLIHTTLEQTGDQNSEYNAKYYAYAEHAEPRGFPDSGFTEWSTAEAAMKKPIETKITFAESQMDRHLKEKGKIDLLKQDEAEWDKIHPSA